MKRLSKLFGAALVSASLLAGSPAAQAKDTILVTEAFHSLLYLPVYVARHQGLFEKYDIEVSSIRAAGSGPVALASVLAGEAQFSVHGPEHVGFARERGGQAHAISAVANSAPVWVLARKEVQFSGPADLKGKRVAVGLAPGTSNTLIKRLILDNKMKVGGDVRLIEVQNMLELGPVLAGSADIAVVYQPVVEQGLAQGLKMVHDFTADYPEYAFSTINTSKKLIETNPGLVQRFVNAIRDSLALIHAQPEVAKAVARKEFDSLDPAVVNAAVQRMIDSNVYPPTVMITEKAFENAISMQQFVGNIKGEMRYADLVDPSFARNAMKK
ncbi:MAG: ABC transporter substrate-binding protein [Burkholderiales bacterium]|nr:ABC transporter substrate-binding protein [Burkholderiales bacterium]